MILSKRFSYILFLMTGLFIIGSYHSAMANHNTMAKDRQNLAVNLRDMPLLKQVTVTSRQQVIGRKLPNEFSEIVFTYPYGAQLDVVEELGEWYGIRDIRVNYEDVEGKPSYPAKKAYVKKAQTGQRNELALIQNDLNILNYISIGEDYERFEDGKALKGYFKFELIDKALFEKKRPLAVDFLSKDTGIKKKNGVLSIPTAKKLVKFVDKDNGDDGDATFKYIGSIDFLNQHLVNGQYWEIADYKMIDNNTGETTQTFIEYPYISPNKKYIISAYANPYEQYTDLELYKLEGTDIIPIMSAGFENWMPATEPEDIFWARDGYLYLAVTHSAAFWKTDGSLNDKFQYIRIKVD